MSGEVRAQSRPHLIESWCADLSAAHFAVLSGTDLAARLPDGIGTLTEQWAELERDEALVDGGTYRFRRYGRLLVEFAAGGWSHSPLPHTTFQQDADYIPDYAGRAREFSPIPPDVLLDPALLALVSLDLDIVRASGAVAATWEVGLHMVRIVASADAPGNPTPEGRHRDGHDYIGMHLMRRENCAGGESTVYRNGHPPTCLTLEERLDSLIVADARVTHGVTAIHTDHGTGVRDMLLVDLNAR